MVAALALFGLGAGALRWGTDHYGDQVARIPDAFPAGPRPPRPAAHDGGRTFLLAGLDSRSERHTTGSDATARLWTYGAQRSDALMLVHLGGEGHGVHVLSIPRDSWVPVPGHGSAKINAAFSWGGPPLMIRTVERFAGTRVDHFGVIDWNGFKALTDAVGGVTVTVHEDSYDAARHRRWTAGPHVLRGADALAYVGQRYGLPRGDLDRITRQQQFLRGLIGRIRDRVDLTDPLGTARTLDAVTRTLSVDDRMSNSDLRDLVFGLRDLDASDVHFATAPVLRSETIGGQSVLVLDRAKLRARWHAVETGAVD
ncbi:LCP family protein [Streptomyces canus]|uniref:LCP family protein n=1 Tax=Streptomyces canus TaxID=58343 RepID=UPI0007C55285|nr:LCP family protein [Streptomyces canus]